MLTIECFVSSNQENIGKCDKIYFYEEYDPFMNFVFFFFFSVVR